MIPRLHSHFEVRPIEVVVFTSDQIQFAWNELEPFIQRSIDASCNGEMLAEQVRELLMKQEAIAFATVRDGKLMMVLVARMVSYATFNSVRILTCAGTGLKDAMKFLDALEAWALTQGAVEIEAFCRPAMYRLARRLGWVQKRIWITRDLRRRLQ